MAAEHTVLIVDNQRINNPQNGQADFGILSRFDLERVEVVRGGFSALYGADAMGGVVRAFTRKPTRDMRVHASLGSGSAGYLSRELSVSGSTGSLGLLVGVRSEKGNGKYPYYFEQGPAPTQYVRLGADYDVVEAQGRLTWQIQPNLETEFVFSGTDADRGVPGPVIRPDDQGGARLADQVARWRWTSTWQPTSATTALLSASLDALGQQYVDPSLTLGEDGALSSTSSLRMYRIAPELEHAFDRWLVLAAGAELQRSRLSASSVGEAERNQVGLWLTFRVSGRLGEDFFSEVTILPSLRYDRFSDMGEAWSPKIGLNLQPLRSLPVKIRATYGANFRAPTFNELYWTPGGNSALRPERATMFDAGLVGSVPFAGQLRLEIGMFLGETHDRILWVPGAGGIWSSANIGQVSTHGTELEASWVGFGGVLNVTLNSTWIDARKTGSGIPGDPTVGNQVIYVPRQTVNATAMVDAGSLTVRMQHNWVSYRFTTEANDQFLPSYGVTSASARIQIPMAGMSIALGGEVNNIFNVSYDVMPQYPMPLRTFRVSLGVDL